MKTNQSKIFNCFFCNQPIEKHTALLGAPGGLKCPMRIEPTKPFCGECDHYHTPDEKHETCEVCHKPKQKCTCQFESGHSRACSLFVESSHKESWLERYYWKHVTGYGTWLSRFLIKYYQHHKFKSLRKGLKR